MIDLSVFNLARLVPRARMPVFMQKTKDIQECVRRVMLPKKSTVLREHFADLESAHYEDEIIDLKLIVFHEDMCDKMDSKITVEREVCATNTANLW